jgi:23S rRNA pseudouridine1911/1915/1917 synthase
VIIVTKNVETHDFIAEQFMKRKVRKLYLAIVKGEPPESVGRIETGIIRDPRNRKRFTWSATEGKKAVTFYRILKAFTGYAYVAYKPRTGRTHQIRVHSLYMQCPILGDPIYSRRDSRWPDAGLMLHSHRLALRIPGGQMPGGIKKVFKAPLPEEFKKALRILQNQAL